MAKTVRPHQSRKACARELNPAPDPDGDLDWSLPAANAQQCNYRPQGLRSGCLGLPAVTWDKTTPFGEPARAQNLQGGGRGLRDGWARAALQVQNRARPWDPEERRRGHGCSRHSPGKETGEVAVLNTRPAPPPRVTGCGANFPKVGGGKPRPGCLPRLRAPGRRDGSGGRSGCAAPLLPSPGPGGPPGAPAAASGGPARPPRPPRCS